MLNTTITVTGMNTFTELLKRVVFTQERCHPGKKKKKKADWVMTLVDKRKIKKQLGLKMQSTRRLGLLQHENYVSSFHLECVFFFFFCSNISRTLPCHTAMSSAFKQNCREHM